MKMQTKQLYSCGTKYEEMDQIKFFKGYFPQILLYPLFNTLSHL